MIIAEGGHDEEGDHLISPSTPPTTVCYDLFRDSFFHWSQKRQQWYEEFFAFLLFTFLCPLVATRGEQYTS